jgi:hypothetical protein
LLALRAGPATSCRATGRASNSSAWTIASSLPSRQRFARGLNPAPRRAQASDLVRAIAIGWLVPLYDIEPARHAERANRRSGACRRGPPALASIRGAASENEARPQGPSVLHSGAGGRESLRALCKYSKSRSIMAVTRTPLAKEWPPSQARWASKDGG